MALDLREALNTISDVVQNRPPPLREFDQIYMKVGDMVIQAEFIARKFNDLDIVFIGDGDAISLGMMYLKQKKVLDYGPKHIRVLDFDERMVNSINHFASNNELADKIDAIRYNVCDPLPAAERTHYDGFYTNPPWGASNDGQSVTAFVTRGIEAVKSKGIGAIVIADDESLDWTNHVLLRTQQLLMQSGYIVAEMIPGLHKYHLDDAPDLSSCCIITRNIVQQSNAERDKPLAADALLNFYGRNNPLRVRYVVDLSGLNRGRAPDGSYELIPLEAKNERDH